MPKHTKAFKVNLSRITDELHLADSWGKASIIFTIHKDIFSQKKTKQALNKKLENFDFKFIEIETNKVEGNFIEYLLHRQDVESTIFYISNIDWGGGEDNKDFYRILNLHRETFIEHKMKVIFFLSLNEASKLPHYAPDFWAFRHLVLEFATSSPRNKRKPPVGIMLWQIEHSTTQNINLESKISYLKKTLNEIPDQSESIALRIDMQRELGYLSWQEGNLVDAEKSLENGLNLAQSYNFSEARALLINGLAIIDYERENYQNAFDLLEPVVRENPRDCLLLMNQAIAMFALNKRYEAMKKGLKATTLCVQNAWVENTLGFLYYFAGKMDEAIIRFQKAVDISPKNVYFHEALVICYQAMGLHNNAHDQLLQAIKWSLERKVLHDILKVSISEKRENTLDLIKGEFGTREHNTRVFVRNPILFALLAPQKTSKIQALWESPW